MQINIYSKDKITYNDLLQTARTSDFLRVQKIALLNLHTICTHNLLDIRMNTDGELYPLTNESYLQGVQRLLTVLHNFFTRCYHEGIFSSQKTPPSDLIHSLSNTLNLCIQSKGLDLAYCLGLPPETQKKILEETFSALSDLDYTLSTLEERFEKLPLNESEKDQLQEILNKTRSHLKALLCAASFVHEFVSNSKEPLFRADLQKCFEKAYDPSSAQIPSLPPASDFEENRSPSPAAVWQTNEDASLEKPKEIRVSDLINQLHKPDHFEILIKHIPESSKQWQRFSFLEEQESLLTQIKRHFLQLQKPLPPEVLMHQKLLADYKKSHPQTWLNPPQNPVKSSFTPLSSRKQIRDLIEQMRKPEDFEKICQTAPESLRPSLRAHFFEEQFHRIKKINQLIVNEAFTSTTSFEEPTIPLLPSEVKEQLTLLLQYYDRHIGKSYKKQSDFDRNQIVYLLESRC
jgi:hypothetical protein